MRDGSTQALQRHRASLSDHDATVVRVHTRFVFKLGDNARTKFVPLDLLPRVLSRAHAVAGVRRGGENGEAALLWRDGCVYELSSGCVGKLNLEGRHLLVRDTRDTLTSLTVVCTCDTNLHTPRATRGGGTDGRTWRVPILPVAVP